MSNYEFSADDPARRLAEVRRILAEQGARFPQVDHNGRVTTGTDEADLPTGDAA